MTNAPMPLDTCCPCGGEHAAEARTAAHDHRLIDLLVVCESCGRTLNAFLKLEEDFLLVASDELDQTAVEVERLQGQLARSAETIHDIDAAADDLIGSLERLRALARLALPMLPEHSSVRHDLARVLAEGARP